MALNFPSNPIAGDTYVVGNIIYIYNGIVWSTIGANNVNNAYANDWATYSNLVWTVQDEGSNVYTAPRVVNFVGSGVSVSNTNSTVTVSIAGGGGGGDANDYSTWLSAMSNDYGTYSNLVWTVQDEGSNVYTAPRIVNFVGSGVSVSNSNSTVTVTVSGGGGGDPSNYVTVTGDYSMTTTNDIVVSLASTDIVVTLPNASTVKSYYFQNMGTSSMTLATVSNQLINSSNTLTLEFTGSSCRLLSNSSAYLIF